MNLPDYFIADLPPEAIVTPRLVQDACQTLKQNREKFLAERSTRSRIELLCRVAADWLRPEDPFRKRALDSPAATGFSRQTLERGLDQFFRQFTPENFEALLIQELGHPDRMDRIVASELESKQGRAAIARAPSMLAHVTAGNIPNSALMNMAIGVLTRSAQFVKCATGASLLPRLFAHSLYAAEPKVGACLEIAEWSGGNEPLEAALFQEADCLTATGSDEALDSIRRRLPDRVRFLGHGHRVSFALIAEGALKGGGTQALAAAAAMDVTAWNQLGCLSPHVFYLEGEGTAGARNFAEALASELESCERTNPRGPVPAEVAATIASRRSFYEVRAANSSETRLWQSKGSTAWTVVYEASPQFQPSCLHRFVYVKSIRDVDELFQAADAVCGKVSTVGLAAPDEVEAAMALRLARWGVTRVCRIGEMQNPPLTWRHDGRPAMSDLITWTDWERSAAGKR